ncbi:MAG: hypothetical protein JOZ58_05025 [Acetobacteraceae bacterium]|nr:hypothetical protein [Acetobacteraceae bacterium]
MTFMVNGEEEAPTGRPAEALGWAGLANLFYWIDWQNGFGGFCATQILLFADPSSFLGHICIPFDDDRGNARVSLGRNAGNHQALVHSARSRR